MLTFRTTKGQINTEYANIDYADSTVEEDQLTSYQNRTVFFSFFIGGQRDVIKQKLIALCEVFHAKTHSLPTKIS